MAGRVDPDIEKILRVCPKTRQTMLLSATVPPPVQRLAQRYMHEPENLDFSPQDAHRLWLSKVVLIPAGRCRSATVACEIHVNGHEPLALRLNGAIRDTA